MIVRTAVFDEPPPPIASRAAVDCVLNLAGRLDCTLCARHVVAPTPTFVGIAATSRNFWTTSSTLLRDEEPFVRYEAVKVDLTDAARDTRCSRRLGPSRTRPRSDRTGLLTT
jgi:hypothetical protein